MEVHSLTRRQLEDYRSHLQAEEKSTATQEAYMRTALAFFADSAGAVTKASAAVYKRRLLAGGYAVRTVNARLAALNGQTTRVYVLSTGREHRRRMENLHLIL